jgi:hypothetical protein
MPWRWSAGSWMLSAAQDLGVEHGAGEDVAHVVQHVGGHLGRARLARPVPQPGLGLPELPHLLLQSLCERVVRTAQGGLGALDLRMPPRVLERGRGFSWRSYDRIIVPTPICMEVYV